MTAPAMRAILLRRQSDTVSDLNECSLLYVLNRKNTSGALFSSVWCRSYTIKVLPALLMHAISVNCGDELYACYAVRV